MQPEKTHLNIITNKFFLLIYYDIKNSIMKYTIIKTKNQYDQYCTYLEELVTQASSGEIQDEIELLTLLIEKYDEEHNILNFQSIL